MPVGESCQRVVVDGGGDLFDERLDVCRRFLDERLSKLFRALLGLFLLSSSLAFLFRFVFREDAVDLLSNLRNS